MISVNIPQRQTCKSSENLETDSNIRYVSSLVSRNKSCGFHNSPWILKSKPGQQIEISLLDFSWTNTSGDGNCFKSYGYILDVESDDVINICGGTWREKHLYRSGSNSVQIVLDQVAVQGNYFLIAYKGITRFIISIFHIFFCYFKLVFKM